MPTGALFRRRHPLSGARRLAVVALLGALGALVALVAGCGGGDERPELEASAVVAKTEPAVTTEETTTVEPPATGSPGAAATAVSARQRRKIAAQAVTTAAALTRWDEALAACIGPSGAEDDAGSSCTRAAWEQLFDQLHVAHTELLRMIGRTPAGRCHEALSSAVDAVHGFLSGATPSNVVWLDEQQRPPSRFDLDAIADLARPAPGRLRDAASTACVA
ncbi:MAG TPA: hypothetical protein VFU99_10235 [Gaiellaceae bacterium]|nr:hypothetical protein [Gaiellaceae bacterium]